MEQRTIVPVYEDKLTYIMFKINTLFCITKYNLRKIVAAVLSAIEVIKRETKYILIY